MQKITLNNTTHRRDIDNNGRGVLVRALLEAATDDWLICEKTETYYNGQKAVRANAPVELAFRRIHRWHLSRTPFLLRLTRIHPVRCKIGHRPGRRYQTCRNTCYLFGRRSIVSSVVHHSIVPARATTTDGESIYIIYGRKSRHDDRKTLGRYYCFTRRGRRQCRLSPSIREDFEVKKTRVELRVNVICIGLRYRESIGGGTQNNNTGMYIRQRYT